MNEFEDKVIKHDVEIAEIKKDIDEMRKEVKDGFTEIKKMLNGYMDKKIETKIKSMNDYFQQIAIDAYAKLAGKRALAFAVSLITSFVVGALAGRFFWR